MGKPNMVIEHNFTQDEAVKHLQPLLQNVIDKLTFPASKLQEEWQKNINTFSFSVMKQEIKGTITVLPKQIKIDYNLPIALKVFKSKIDDLIKNRTEKLLK